MGRLKVNTALLPIKGHYFCFMAALGPILPQMSVYGKEMGISPVVMGTVTGILPFVFLLAKPIFGLIVDIFRQHRKAIFVGIIVTMSMSFALLYVAPPRELLTIQINATCHQMETCNVTIPSEVAMICSNEENPNVEKKIDLGIKLPTCDQKNLTQLCSLGEAMIAWKCLEDIDANPGRLYASWQFWYFIVLMSIGMICFNVANSISDAICFDVIGEDYDYGLQRVWGTVGFGLTALLGGFIVNMLAPGEPNAASYGPAFLIMLVFTGVDLYSCAKLQLPVMETPKNIFKDLRKLLKSRHTITFVTFSVFAGILDGFIVYFLFWYLEDLAIATHTGQIKLIEGLIVAAETLGGEVIFFSISGKILERIGHGHSFSMCFINYALRLGLMSVVPNPWWAIPIEFMMQGPTYALTYTTIVAYANAIAPPGASATMQGIAAGMDDGFGYSIGSLLGGCLYISLGGKQAFQIFSIFALICSISHLFLYKFYLQRSSSSAIKGERKTPGAAALGIYSFNSTRECPSYDRQKNRREQNTA